MMRISRSTARARHAALGRLDSITSGIAVAGVAATIGFAALSAATFRGTASSTVATGPSSDDTTTVRNDDQNDEQDDGFRPFTSDSGSGSRSIPGSAGSGPSRAAAPGQVTTGGS